VWVTPLRRTLQTARGLPGRPTVVKALREIEVGQCTFSDCILGGGA
jgi:hypothetical protein